jgi:hypothetical protein
MEAAVEVATQPKAHSRSAVVFFAPTIFLGAFLLFCCEPMVGKMLLPLLGGASSVWITCLLFFQLMLLAGYGYAHVLERYADTGRQMLVHVALMLAALLFLPIEFTARPDAAASGRPTLWLLTMLIRSVAVPFCVVATTAPLLQNWLSKTRTASAQDPYFLYAISNAGSFAALLAYPILLEPRWGVRVQSSTWFAGYGLLVLLVIAAALFVRFRSLEGEGAPQQRVEQQTGAASWNERLFWVAAAFVPSGLMLAVTNHMLLNLASVPFLWVMPLAIYLLTFIIAFARRFRLSHRVLSAVVPIVLLLVFPLVAVSRPVGSRTLFYVLAAHLLVLFAGALLCHTALASRRPAATNLTEFYVWMALGGALGGIFVAVLAPLVFSSVIEYPLLVATIALFRATSESDGKMKWGDWIYPAVMGALVAAAWYGFDRADVDLQDDYKTALAVNTALVLVAYFAHKRRVRFALVLAVLLAGYRLAVPGFFDDYEILHTDRNFFGVKKIVYDLGSNSRKLLHGDTLHGIESMDPRLAGQPLSYYHDTGPVGDIIRLISERPTQHVGVVGLGTGSMAGWSASNRRVTFFDIDPQVAGIAQRFFTYLRRCADQCDIVIGDGRLSIERAPAKQFDLLMLDAFSSDSIPAHLVSREAVQLYLTKLKDDGLILFHVSNRYMDVQGLVSAVTLDAGLEGLIRYDYSEQETGKSGSDYVVAARQREHFGDLNLDLNWTPVEKPAGIRPWTDDYSNMMTILRWP